MKQIIHPPGMPAPASPYVPAVVAGGFSFVSGQVGTPVDEDGSPRGIEDQTRDALGRVEQILQACGSGLDQLVKVTVYLTDMKNDFRVYNRLWAEHFKDVQPCRTTVEVNALPTPIAIELKCMATVE